MKKISLMILSVMLFTVVSIAQNRGNFDPKEFAKRQTEELTKELSLNKDQQKKVLELNNQVADKMTAMREDMMSGGGDREGMRDKMMKIREDQQKEMKKILTEDQYKKYEKYLEEQRARRGQRGPGGGR